MIRFVVSPSVDRIGQPGVLVGSQRQAERGVSGRLQVGDLLGHGQAGADDVEGALAGEDAPCPGR